MSRLSAPCVKFFFRTRQQNVVELKQFSTVSPKLKEKKVTTPAEKSSKLNQVHTKDLIKYLDSKTDLKLAKTQVSPYLLKSRLSVPESLYLISNDTAKDIVSSIGDKLTGDSSVIEVNPGIGCLTKELLKLNINNLNLFESSVYHADVLDKLHKDYPNKFNYTIADFFGIWKIAYQDKMDGGNRVETLLQEIPTKSWEDGVSMKILGSIGSPNFIKDLILFIVFQDTIIAKGRPELFITLPPACYYSLVPPPDSVQYTHLLRPGPVLFNLLFDNKLITKVPRKNFLPWSKYSRKSRGKVKDIDIDYMYLVNIVVKEKLPCSCENLILLWYFCKHNLMNQNNRVIPMLEQWIPGCGVWLITGQDPPGSNLETLPSTDDALLPHMTIFTQFRDLTPQQKLTVFKKFISWPDFQQCPFKETVEHHIFKVASARFYTPKEDMEQEDDPNESQRL